MPTTTDNAADLHVTEIAMEFEGPTAVSVLPLGNLANLLVAIEVAFTTLDHIARINATERAFATRPHVISLSMHSPLQLRLGFSASKNAIKAIVEFISSVMFYKERQQLLKVEIAMGWEHVVALRLKNIKTAVDIATNADATRPDQIKQPSDYQVHRLLEAAFKMDQSELKLKNIDVSDDDH